MNNPVECLHCGTELFPVHDGLSTTDGNNLCIKCFDKEVTDYINRNYDYDINAV